MPTPMRKKVKRVIPAKITGPLGAYLRSKERIERPKWTYYLVDGEYYIHERFDDGGEEVPDYLLQHWTITSCCGLANWMRDHGIKEQRQFPLVGIDGQYLFEVVYSDDYEMSVRNAEGKLSVVYSG